MSPRGGAIAPICVTWRRPDETDPDFPDRFGSGVRVIDQGDRSAAGIDLLAARVTSGLIGRDARLNLWLDPPAP